MKKGYYPIYIVEDDEDDYLLTLEAFKEAEVNSEVVWVRDGEELLEMLQCGVSQNQEKGAASSTVTTAVSLPSLILLDLNLPKKSGREVLAAIKKCDNLKHIPVVVLSTSTAESDIAHAYQCGVNSFIQKPRRFSELVDVIKGITNYWFGVVKLPQ